MFKGFKTQKGVIKSPKEKKFIRTTPRRSGLLIDKFAS